MASKSTVDQHMASIEQAATEFVTAEKVTPLLMQFLAGLVLLIAACVQCGNLNKGIPSAFQVDCSAIKNWAYTVSAASIAIFTSISAIVLLRCARSTYDKVLATSSQIGDLTIGFLIAIFHFLWWGIAAGIITFQGPFTDTGNGYFAAWAGFLFSIVGIGASVTKAWSVAANSGPTIGLFIASVVVFCALLGDEAIGGGKAYQGEAIYALIISILTTLVVAIMLILESNGQEETVVKVKMPMYLFFGVLWIVLACLVTFSGPFTGTGNGYFGSWAGATLCLCASFPTTTQALAMERCSEERRSSEAKPTPPQAVAAASVDAPPGDSV